MWTQIGRAPLQQKKGPLLRSELVTEQLLGRLTSKTWSAKSYLWANTVVCVCLKNTTWWKERINSWKLSSDLYMHAEACAQPWKIKSISKCFKNYCCFVIASVRANGWWLELWEEYPHFIVCPMATIIMNESGSCNLRDNVEVTGCGLKLFFMCMGAFAWMSVCLCIMCIPGALRFRRRYQVGWNWSYRQFGAVL